MILANRRRISAASHSHTSMRTHPCAHTHTAKLCERILVQAHHFSDALNRKMVNLSVAATTIKRPYNRQRTERTEKYSFFFWEIFPFLSEGIKLSIFPAIHFSCCLCACVCVWECAERCWYWFVSVYVMENCARIESSFHHRKFKGMTKCRTNFECIETKWRPERVSEESSNFYFIFFTESNWRESIIKLHDLRRKHHAFTSYWIVYPGINVMFE